MDTAALHEIFLNSTGVTTDTRKIAKNYLFFALHGEHFNGNEFAQQALDSGASYAVIDDPKFHSGDRTIVVNNSLQTLQELAKFHRQYLNLPLLALTGSNGKTTTKELLNAVLSKKFKTVATVGNLNNHIGVPLTLLAMDKKTEFGVVEMGANHPKEIEFLCNIALPDYGYITNFGKAHLEGFGSIEGVIQAKSELYQHLMQRDKTIFYNVEDPVQKKKLMTHTKVYGFASQKSNLVSDVKIDLTQSQPFVSVNFNNIEIPTKLIGAYNYTNIAAAACVGSYFKIKTIDIKDAISNYTPSNNRSQIIEKGKMKIILDAYNANPSSVQAALNNFAQQSQENKTLILGDMLELGTEAAAEHQDIVDQITEYGFENVYLIGQNFYNTDGDYLKFKNFEEFKIVFTNTRKGKHPELYLIKGSRGMALERTLELF
ncbi:UDP-N-acetylmuramoyl-tripeptide--D-alanyl-D-alanine ligase [Galbibacter sp.]|uniref:UDP-N-acetylmuramoyl-tripeptide--D-alanyl-D- alanine ligase n=1 Tax=Galbibacter sp. TaxID=2918471 RepID=UPI003A92953C